MHLRCGLWDGGWGVVTFGRVGISLGSDSLHLKHVNDGQESHEKEKEKNKKSDRSDKEGDIDPCR